MDAKKELKINEARLMTTDQAARYLSLSPGTLRQWACQRISLPVVRIGRRVLYDRRTLDAWIERNTHEPEGDELLRRFGGNRR